MAPAWKRRLGNGGVVLVCVGLVVLWAPRLALSAYAGSALAPFGVVCSPLTIEPAWDLSGGHLAATECTIAEGPIASVALEGGATVRMVDYRPVDVELASLAINPRAVADADDLGGALLLGEVPEPMRRALDALASLSARPDVPHVAIHETTVGRGNVLLLHELVVDRTDDGLSITVASAGPPPHLGRVVRASIAIEDVVAHATAAEATVQGRLALEAQLASSDLERSIPFRVTGTGLDTDAPAYELWIEPSPLLDRARAALVAMRARIDAAGSRVEAVHEAIRQHGEERRERLDALRESLEQRVEEGHREESAP